MSGVSTYWVTEVTASTLEPSLESLLVADHVRKTKSKTWNSLPLPELKLTKARQVTSRAHSQPFITHWHGPEQLPSVDHKDPMSPISLQCPHKATFPGYQKDQTSTGFSLLEHFISTIFNHIQSSQLVHHQHSSCPRNYKKSSLATSLHITYFHRYQPSSEKTPARTLPAQN